MSYKNQVPAISIDLDFNDGFESQFHKNASSSLSKSPSNFNTISLSPNLTSTTFNTSDTLSPISLLSINSNGTGNNHATSTMHNNRPMSLDFTPLNLFNTDSSQQQQQQLSQLQPQLGIRNRHRAGTLPSRFQTSATSSLSSNTNLLSTPSLASLGTSATQTLSPSMGTSEPVRNRLRSNSYQNTIWNSSSADQQTSPLIYPSIQTPSIITPNFAHSNPTNTLLPFNNDSMLLPPLSMPVPQSQSHINPAQPPQQQPAPSQTPAVNRLRSFSTNTAIANHPDLKNYYLQPFSSGSNNNNIISEEYEADQAGAMSSSIPKLYQSPPNSEGSSLNPLMYDYPQYVERPRSQTFTNGVSTTLPMDGRLRDLPGMQFGHNYHQYQHQQQPVLLDDVPQSLVNFVSTFQDPTLAPSETVVIVNLPKNGVVSLLNLYKILSKFGAVKEVRVINCNNGDLISLATFGSIENAVNCKLNLNNLELVPGLSCIVAFAKILDQQQQPSQNQMDMAMQQQLMSQQQQQQQQHQQQQQKPSNPPLHHQKDDMNSSGAIFPELTFKENLALYKLAIAQFDDELSPKEMEYVHHLVRNATKYELEPGFGPLPSSSIMREFDSPKLREIRKEIENNKISQLNVEQLALLMINEIPELASDYLGNTIVQKLFDICSAPIRDIMLLKVSPYLSQMGIHKNGTWAAQKLMTTATTIREQNIISRALKPYCSNLFNDQFGNYVLQRVLKYGSPYNDFIVELMLADFLEISKGRFGLRAIRACLESSDISKEQMVTIAGAIVANCNNLATNLNGSLLVTWYLDTCQLKDRHMVLLPSLLPHLKTLCTHKLGSLIILKMLNFRNDLRLRNLLLKEVFGEVVFKKEEEQLQLKPSGMVDVLPLKTTKLLHDILSDNLNGVTFICKTLSIPLLEPALKLRIIQLIRVALIDLNVSSYQGYKRILEEVGLRSSNGNGNMNRRSGQGRNGLSGYFQPPNQQQQQQHVPQQNAPQQQNVPQQQNTPQQQQQQQHAPQQQTPPPRPPQPFLSMDQFYKQQGSMQPQFQYPPQQQSQLYMGNQQQEFQYPTPMLSQRSQDSQQQRYIQNDVMGQLEKLSLASLLRGYSDSPIGQHSQTSYF